jgi:integrase
VTGRRKSGKRVETAEGVRVFGKAANGDGSVYKQADGRWRATWWVPGEGRPRSATGKTRQQAIDRRAVRRKSSVLDREGLSTVGALADWWLHNVHKSAVRASSWAKAEDRVRRIKETLGDRLVVDLSYRAVAEWQASIGTTLAPRTVRHHRQTLAQIVDEAVKLGALVGNPVRSVKPPAVTSGAGVALKIPQIRALIQVAAEHRHGAAVALLFLQGWRVSEVLGLAWEDLDLDARTARVQRASVYVDGRGQQLGPTKTDSAQGEHWLLPTVVALLRAHREFQEQERAVAPWWDAVVYEGEEIQLVFTTPTGGLVLRQSISKVIRQAAKTAGITVSLNTHDGRRSVITALWDEGDVSLDDIGIHVGQLNPKTTEAYVKRRGRRPKRVARRAEELLDSGPEVRNHPGEDGSNAGSDDREPARSADDTDEGNPSSERPETDGPGRF